MSINQTINFYNENFIEILEKVFSWYKRKAKKRECYQLFYKKKVDIDFYVYLGIKWPEIIVWKNGEVRFYTNVQFLQSFPFLST